MLPSNNKGFPAPFYLDSVVTMRGAGGAARNRNEVQITVLPGCRRSELPAPSAPRQA